MDFPSDNPSSMDTIIDTVHSSLPISDLDGIPPRESSSVPSHSGEPFLVAGAHSYAPTCGGVSPGLLSGTPPLPRNLPKISVPEPSLYSIPVADGEVSALYTAAALVAVFPVVLRFIQTPGREKGAGTTCHNQLYTAAAPVDVAPDELPFSQAAHMEKVAGTTCHNQLYGVPAGLPVCLMPPQALQGGHIAFMALAVQGINPTPGSNDFPLTGGVLESNF